MKQTISCLIVHNVFHGTVEKFHTPNGVKFTVCNKQICKALKGFPLEIHRTPASFVVCPPLPKK